MSKNKNKPGERWKNPLFVETAGARKVAESLTLGQQLRRKTAEGCALGTFLIELPCTSTLTALSLAGFDFVVLDMEHSSVDFSTLEPLLVAAQAAGLTALVRTWADRPGLIGKALDMGAHGVMVPHVDSPERARAIVQQARYAPLGGRGFSPLTRYNALSEPLETLNESTYVVIQIEGGSALEQVGTIASVPGVDAVFVGPYDLALSLGLPPGSAAVHAAAEHIPRAVPDGVASGIYIDDPARCADWAARGFSLQCVCFDSRMLFNGALSVVAQAKRRAPGSGGKV